jgi:uncharacterized membrane protein (DUF373 family)
MDVDIREVTVPAEDIMQWLVLAVAYFLLILFAIGVLDLCLQLFSLVRSGQFTDPVAVVNLLDSVLLLLILVEVHRTLIAYARDDPVLRIVVSTAIIAVARRVISFRPEAGVNGQETLFVATAFSVLVLTLIVGYFMLNRVDIER